MSKYIDAEKLKRLVGELKMRAKRNRCDSWGIVPDALEEVEGFITSLQQEQPEVQNEKFIFPKYLYARTKDNKTIDMSYAPQDMTAIEYIRNDFVQSGLDEAAEKYSENILANNEDLQDAIEDAFKAGAEWMAGQGYVKEGIARPDDCEIWVNMTNTDIKDGDEVIVQIRKK